MLSESNLFKYATSELSQDAFICWLMSHALKNNKNADPILRECARDFLKEMTGTYVEDIIKINRQYKKIDILIKTDNFSIIIEDKTYSDTHDDQIKKYKDVLISEGELEERIRCVYYKIVEQPRKEPNVDVQFDREKILGILRKYDNCDNQIFIDYKEWLECIEAESHAYENVSITKWNDNQWRGFFVGLVNKKIINIDENADSESWGWGYINNRKGGFWGLWWSVINDNEKLEKMRITSNIADSIYLQIEANVIVLKISASKNEEYDKSEIYNTRWNLYNKSQKILKEYDNNIEFKKSAFRFGKCMTIGWIQYDEQNYQERLKCMEALIKDLIIEPKEERSE